MNKHRIVSILVALALASGVVPGAAFADGADTAIHPQLLDQIQGAAPEQRLALLTAKQVDMTSWTSTFTAAGARYLGGKAQQRASADYLTLLTGARLARLTGAVDLAPTLEALTRAEDMPEAITYEALVSLSSLGTSDALLTTMLDGKDPGRVRLAVLAIAERGEEPGFADRLEDLARRRGSDNQISAALQFAGLYRHDRDLYASFSSLTDKLAFVEERLRRAHNPINGVTQSWDPYSAGHPVSRWAMDRWRDLASRYQSETAAYISAVVYPSVETSARYRNFLADVSSPEARHALNAQVADKN